MPVTLKHVYLELSFPLGAKLHLEELALFVGDNIERIVRASATPREIFWTNDPKPRAHASELICDRFRVHDLMIAGARIFCVEKTGHTRRRIF